MNKSTRKLSFLRVLIVLIMIGVLFYANNHLKEERATKFVEAEIITEPYSPWFGSYVDVTATPTYAFEQLGSSSTPSAILSFIVSSKEDACIPTWGTHYTMDEAAESLDLDRRIARLQQQGGKIAISFGGALNSELSLKCTNEESLLAAYKSVIDRYNIDTIDLDIENENLKDKESSIRRAKVMAQLQKDYKEKGKNLKIWLTIPVAPHGLTKEGTDAVSIILTNKVDLTGTNLMTMDYGNSKSPEESMFEASKSALTETHRQLTILYAQAEIEIGPRSIWRKIGATPMIGQNDFPEEVFSLENAKDFNLFALEKEVGRMSMWSANRDIPCGENYVNKEIVSDSCSGVEEKKSAFANTLSINFKGELDQSVGIIPDDKPIDNSNMVDDPDSSPYQIWKETGAYPRGVKVVWHGNVYEAKWWTKNDLPDNPVLQSWETPWKLVGPVLEGEKPIKQPTLPAGTYPRWNGKVIYTGGERVLFEGTPFQAKWWNEGESPAAAAANPDSSPWLPLTQKQIKEILEDLEK